MKITDDQKEKLFSLLDYATDGFPDYGYDIMMTDENQSVFYTLFKQLRLELRGY